MQDSDNSLVACEQGQVSAEGSKSASYQLYAYIRNELLICRILYPYYFRDTATDLYRSFHLLWRSSHIDI